jgi:hypothetical protein
MSFWLNICPKPYSQLSVLVVDLLAAPASQALLERLFSVCGMLSNGRRNRMTKSLATRVRLKVNSGILSEIALCILNTVHNYYLYDSLKCTQCIHVTSCVVN